MGNSNIHGENQCITAAKSGDLRELMRARDTGCPWDASICSATASGGHLEVLQWAHENGCPWDYRVCYLAAREGHLNILQWARAVAGCPWNEYTCTGAAIKGHLEVLKWARDNDCQWDSNTCSGAVVGGHLGILRWALDNGCEWNHLGHDTINDVEILRLAYENRIKYDRWMSSNKECLDFLEEYGDAWKKGNFELPHYWKSYHIKGSE